MAIIIFFIFNNVTFLTLIIQFFLQFKFVNQVISLQLIVTFIYGVLRRVVNVLLTIDEQVLIVCNFLFKLLAKFLSIFIVNFFFQVLFLLLIFNVNFTINLFRFFNLNVYNDLLLNGLNVYILGTIKFQKFNVKIRFAIRVRVKVCLSIYLRLQFSIKSRRVRRVARNARVQRVQQHGTGKARGGVLGGTLSTTTSFGRLTKGLAFCFSTWHLVFHFYMLSLKVDATGFAGFFGAILWTKRRFHKKRIKRVLRHVYVGVIFFVCNTFCRVFRHASTSTIKGNAFGPATVIVTTILIFQFLPHVFFNDQFFYGLYLLFGLDNVNVIFCSTIWGVV